MKNIIKKAAIAAYTSNLLAGIAFASNSGAAGAGQNGGTNGVGNANGSNGAGNVSCPGNSCGGGGGHGVPEITAVEGAAALAVVIAALLLFRELWKRQKKSIA